MKKLAIITTHPIQYYAPVFKLLQEREKIEINVFYTWGTGAIQKFDPGFSKSISWDIPLLEGYPYEWVENTAADKGSHHFKGIINPDLIQQISSWQPHAILVYGWAYKSHLKAIRYFKNRIPVFFRGDSTLLNKQSTLKNLLRSIFLKWVYKQVDHAFYVGTNSKAYFKKYGLKEEQLTFAPHAIDNVRFMDNDETEALKLRTSLNIGKDDILILYAGKFEALKNINMLLNAFIAINNPYTHLLLVGNGVEELSLKNRAQQSSLSENIHFLDFQNQSYMPILYQAADLFCLPSLSETWGLAVNEAMACSKAVLVSDRVGAATDLVEQEYNGAIFKAQSLESLTGALHQLILLGKKELMNRGANSKKIINNWTFQKQAEAIEAKVLKHD